MQIVIDIPDRLYANLPKIHNGSMASKTLLEFVKNGTPLPKGHGRLIDADKLKVDQALEQLEDTEDALCIAQKHEKRLSVEGDKMLKKLKTLEQEPCEDAVSRRVVKEQMIKYGFRAPDMTVTEFVEDDLPSVQPMRKQEPKTEWEQDHAILKAYSDGANEMLDKIREEIEQNAYPIVGRFNNIEKGMTLYGILQVIDKYKVESEG